MKYLSSMIGRILSSLIWQIVLYSFKQKYRKFPNSVVVFHVLIYNQLKIDALNHFSGL